MKITEQYLMSDNGLALLNKLFFSAGEGIIIANEKGEIILANDRANKLFGYTVGELINMKIEALVPPSDQRNHHHHRNNFFANPSSRIMGVGRDLEGLKKDGDTFPLEISLSFFTHEEHKLVVAFITDISTRKRQEKALNDSRKKLQDHAKDLESKVKERTQELEHLNLGLKSQIRERKLAEIALQHSLAELKKAEEEILQSLEKEKEVNELKSRFVSMASHEFRTPLTTIQSSADLIARYTESDQQDQREKHIKRIRTAVQNLTNILNDYLSLEKLESGAIHINIKEFNLASLVTDCIETFDATHLTDRKIHFSMDSELELINSDMHILKNVLINLISNALKYSSQDISVEVKSSIDNSTINIIDKGIGIPVDEQTKMFERFFRAKNATNIQGNGLGLNIVKRYMDLLEGSITFKSEEGIGSAFKVSFPH